MTVEEVARGLTWQQLAQAAALKAGLDLVDVGAVRGHPTADFELRLTADRGPLVVVSARGGQVGIGIIS